MNLKNLSRFFLQFCLFMTLFIPFEDVQAAEKRTSPMRIVIQVNSFDQISQMKETLIHSLVDYTIYPELIGNIDFEASELKTMSLDLSRTGKQKTAVYLKVKTTKELPEATLFNNILTATIEAEVIDTEAPVISSNVEVIQRSINAELDPYQNVTITDNYDKELSDIRISTDYNPNKAGEYSITYTAQDSAGNVSELTLPIVVSNQKYASYDQDDGLIEEMLNLINSYRASRNLHDLQPAPENANHAAGVRACEAYAYLSHTRPDGRHYKTTFNEYGVEYRRPFEILAMAGTTASDNLAWWKQSAPHNALLLTTTGTHVAIGTCSGMWAAIIYENN